MPPLDPLRIALLAGLLKPVTGFAACEAIKYVLGIAGMAAEILIFRIPISKLSRRNHPSRQFRSHQIGRICHRIIGRSPPAYNWRARRRRASSELREAGFTSIEIEEVRRETQVSSAWEPALGCCQGTPLRGEIESRDPDGLGRATEAVAAVMRERFGSGSFRSALQALLVTAS
jgi:hypothetical protein